MPVEFSWFVDNKVMLQSYIGEITIAELEQATAEVMDVLNDHPAGNIHHLIDFTQMTGFPSQIKNISDISTPVTKHPSLGWVIVFGMQNKLQKFVISTISQLILKRMQVCNTQDEALAILKRVDTTLEI